MDNKTYVFNPQQEIARLKLLIQSLEQRIVELESSKQVDVYGKPTPNWFPTFQPPNVPGYSAQPPIFGPGNNGGVPLQFPPVNNGLMGDWLKVFAVDDNKEIK